MSDVKVEVVRVNGNCTACLEEGDTFLLRGVKIVPHGNDKSCQVAFASVVQNVGRLKLQEPHIFVACPDPGMGEGGNVIFRLQLEQEYDLDKY